MVKPIVVAVGVVAVAVVAGGVSLKFMKRGKAKRSVEGAIAALNIVSKPSVEEVVIEPVEEIVEKPEVVVTPAAVEDIVEPIGPNSILSVARARPVVAPIFWSHFQKEIRRLEVVDLTLADFGDRSKLEHSRGWHKCVLNGHDGIMHVTKQHVSAVVFDGREFQGISTSASRFGSRDLTVLTSDRIKAYLQGH